MQWRQNLKEVRCGSMKVEKLWNRISWIYQIVFGFATDEKTGVKAKIKKKFPDSHEKYVQSFK